MSNLEADQVELAKSLAHPTDKKLRDATVEQLGLYLASVKAISEYDMLKLWKALHYCMWLADKPDIQLQLARDLASFVHVFSKPKLSIRYFQIFCRTIMREWSLLDQHRMNKFYSFFRCMLREMFTSFIAAKWESKHVEGMLNALESEILTKTPNGLRFHAADIYIDELFVATMGKISTAHFLICLQPFLTAIKSATEQVFHDRIASGLFGKLLNKYAKERVVSDEDDNKDSFVNLKTTTLQAKIFDIASSEDISESNRRKVYKIHQMFQAVTKVDFADNDESIDNEMEVEAEVEPVTKIEVVKDKKAEKSKKRKAHKIEEVEELSSSTTSMEIETPEVIPTLVPVPEASTTTTKTPAKVEKTREASIGKANASNTPQPKPQSQVKAQQSGEKLPAAGKPSLNQLAAEPTSAAAPAPAKPQFIASPRFTGSRPGYVFHKV
jgi:ribosomal RNA-processing protein 1